MTPSFPRRALVSALSLSAAAILAASCGGTFDSGKGSGGVVPGDPCTSGETADAKDGCNSCTCSDGAWACTEMACDKDAGTAGCIPGDKRPAGDDCNTCSCSADGTWACTRLACGECANGDTKSDGCNTCTCMNGAWGCTTRACPPPECTDGETMGSGAPSGCGTTCTCVGGSWQCTALPCPPPPVCVEGQTTFDGCNQCTCVGGGWACTDKACPPPTECVPGDQTYDGCNTCTCGADGLWMCTLRACPPPVDGGAVGCGGWLGDTCGPSEYCAYQPGEYCGGADASSVCTPRPEVCDTLYDPVCGCDGSTYGNACEAAMKGTGVYSKGPCATNASP